VFPHLGDQQGDVVLLAGAPGEVPDVGVDGREDVPGADGGVSANDFAEPLNAVKIALVDIGHDKVRVQQDKACVRGLDDPPVFFFSPAALGIRVKPLEFGGSPGREDPKIVRTRGSSGIGRRSRTARLPMTRPSRSSKGAPK